MAQNTKGCQAEKPNIIDRVAKQWAIDTVNEELARLSELGMSIPKACFNQERIEEYFDGFSGGNRDLGYMIDSFIHLEGINEADKKTGRITITIIL